eukprot:TRINITY_DN1066_c0_g2_i1.p1 TRINITY_DN1066_c0_g2~~TRINITY_DN1066_c0_g2_i1.p1  ORF type:complete len:486 (+),score=106.01 TRINITY_DN1066_c0_g2_i1:132-1589(+)
MRMLILLLMTASAHAFNLAVLQPDPQSTAAARLATIETMATEAFTNHSAQLMVLPERWGDDVAEMPGYQTLCRSLKVAIVFTCSASLKSVAILLDSNGDVLLNQSKPISDPNHPTQTLLPQAVTLPLASGESVRVGVLLGSDRWFPENSRALMMAGADVLVAPSEGAMTAMDLRVIGSRSMTHVLAIATATLAGQGAGSSIFSFCGPASVAERSAWLATMTGPNHHLEPDGCVPQVVLGRESGLGVMAIDLAALPQLRRYQTIQGDVARRPFQYQPLCYPPTTPRANPGTTSPGTENLTVTVALLQMAGVNVSSSAGPGADPVAAHLTKAEKFVRQAAAMGADVALMPEMFSVGYGANYPWSPAGTAPGSDELYRWMDSSQSLDGPYVRRMVALAKELDMAIAAAFLEEMSVPAANGVLDRYAPRNSVAVIDRHGNIVYTYAKVHTVFMSEVEVMTTAGRGWYSGQLQLRSGQNVSVGSMICFDR